MHEKKKYFYSSDPEITGWDACSLHYLLNKWMNKWNKNRRNKQYWPQSPIVRHWFTLRFFLNKSWSKEVTNEIIIKIFSSSKKCSCTHLGVERYCEKKVSCWRTQQNECWAITVHTPTNLFTVLKLLFQVAARSLSETCGTDLTVQFHSHAPIAVMKKYKNTSNKASF